MNNNTKNKFIINLTRIFVSIGFLGGLTAIGFLIWKLIPKSDSSSANLKPLGTPLKTTDNFFIEYKLDPDNKNYIFDQTELEKLESDFFKIQHYGPELAELNNVQFGNRNVIRNDPSSGSITNGLTIPQTNQVFIDLSGWDSDFPGKSPEEVSYSVKRDWIFNVLVHEYGHFLTSTYFQNTTASAGNASDSVYITLTNNNGEQVRVPEYWNKEYLDDFQNIFNISTPAGQALSPVENFAYDKSLKNISSKYSLNDLYKYANDKEQTTVDTFKDNLSFFTNTSAPYANWSLTWSKESAESGINKYIFNQDEMGTRLLEQSFYSFPVFKNKNKRGFNGGNSAFNWSRTSPEWWAKGDNNHSYNPFMEDLLKMTNFSSINYDLKGDVDSYTPKIFYPDYIWGGNYQTEAGNVNLPDRQEEYYQDLLKGIGYGDSISKVWFKNNTETKDGKIIDGINDSNRYNTNEIQWIGYIPVVKNEAAPNRIVAFDSNANEIKTTIPIDTRGYGSIPDSEADTSSWAKNPSFNLYAKKDLTTSMSDLGLDENESPTKSRASDPNQFYTPNSEYYSYVTDDYVSATDLSNILNNDPNVRLYFVPSNINDKDVNSAYFSSHPEYQVGYNESNSSSEKITLNHFGQSDPKNYFVSSFPGANFEFENQESQHFYRFVISDSGRMMLISDRFNQKPFQ